MTCREAEFLLRFRRAGVPGAGDFAPEDAAALDRHIAECPHCAAEAQAAAAFDRAVGAAMRSVEVPAGLRERLVVQMSTLRGTQLRRRSYQLAALAASIFLAIGLATGIFTATRPEPNLEALLQSDGNLDLVMRFEPPVLLGPPAAEHVRAREEAVAKWLRDQRLPDLPQPDGRNFDYALEISHHWEDVQGQRVPAVLFRGRDRGFAKVYAFRSSQFNLKHLAPLGDSICQARVFPSDRDGVTFVVVFTGNDLSSFLQGGGSSGRVA
jgi:anti-sigma factor RsiW